jgi:predicted  nucleic acid-binding Zn-ribbon protein
MKLLCLGCGLYYDAGEDEYLQERCPDCGCNRLSEE